MPVFHDVDQGSQEWLKLRIGIPTASEFHRIITPGGKRSTQAFNYACRLVAEDLLKQPLDSIEGIETMERGKDLEPKAIALYEFDTGRKTKKIGFVTTDDGTIGCSPDRLVIDAAGGLECKCVEPQTQVKHMVDGMDDNYIPQIQGSILVTEFEWWDWYSYNPYMPPVIRRVYPDLSYLKKMRDALNWFNDMKAQMLEKCRSDGLFDERERIETAHEQAYAGPMAEKIKNYTGI